MKTLFRRMIAASRLDVQTYEQVEADRASNAGAVFIVVVASIAAAIGSGARDFAGVISGIIVLVLTWLVWVGLTYFIPDSQLLQACYAFSVFCPRSDCRYSSASRFGC